MELLVGMIKIIDFWEASKIYVPSFCDKLRNIVIKKTNSLNNVVPVRVNT